MSFVNKRVAVLALFLICHRFYVLAEEKEGEKKEGG
jgi:hypothetical protein